MDDTLNFKEKSRRKITPAQRAGLEKGMFKPGQSGNPAGRPKGVTLSEEYRKLLATKCPFDKQGRTWAAIIAERVLAAAVKGNIPAAKEVEDRVNGKALQSIELNVPNEIPVEVDFSKIPTEHLRAIMEALRGKKA